MYVCVHLSSKVMQSLPSSMPVGSRVTRPAAIPSTVVSLVSWCAVEAVACDRRVSSPPTCSERALLPRTKRSSSPRTCRKKHYMHWYTK